MRNRYLHLFVSMLLLLSGCPQVQNIRIAQDTPGDIETLLEQHEFARVRYLTASYPDIDTTKLQARIASLESAYEGDVLEQAQALGDDNALLDAVDLLSEALRRVPHSTQLRELRTAFEQQRVHRIRLNERNSLFTRAQYLLDRKRLYAQQLSLQTPGFEERREHTQREHERHTVADRLLEHARYAIQMEELDAAAECLSLARKLDDTPDTAALQAELQTLQKSRQETTRQATSIRKARIKRVTDRAEKHTTEELLTTTQKALDANKLQDAQAAFTKIPSSTSQNSDVIAVQNTLDQAVSTRVRHLIVAGDAQYRAEKIHEALKTWSAALALDPDNVEIRERTDRANKVLANLEELKRRQQK